MTAGHSKIYIITHNTLLSTCTHRYLHDKITNGQVHGIVCPQFACYRLVPIVSILLYLSMHLSKLMSLLAYCRETCIS